MSGDIADFADSHDFIGRIVHFQHIHQMSMGDRVDRKLGSVYTLNPLVGNGWVVSVIGIASVCGVGKPGGHNVRLERLLEYF